MHRTEGSEVARFSNASANDILLAACCESGCVLVTDNERDCQRIRRLIRFEFPKPWPHHRPARRT
jgi:predicted nucleic acid-binding protein